MNRRGFLGKLGMALAAVAVAPAINLLAEENSICAKGLLWYAEHYGNRCTYNGNLTLDDFGKLITLLEQQPFPDECYYFQGSSSYQQSNLYFH